MEHNDKLAALAAWTGLKVSDFTEREWSHYGLTVHEGGGCEYAVGDDDECDAAALASIRDSVWAFNAAFLASFTGLPEDMFEAVQKQYENANDAVLKCINANGGIELFAEKATDEDGRGHFLATYDSEEIEQDEFYIYRMN